MVQLSEECTRMQGNASNTQEAEVTLFPIILMQLRLSANDTRQVVIEAGERRVRGARVRGQAVGEQVQRRGERRCRGRVRG